MRSRLARNVARLAPVALFLSTAATTATACNDGSEARTVPAEDAATAPDAATDAADAADAQPTPVDGPGEEGEACTFNRECGAALRCACVDEVCTCQPGERGAGQNGIDTCDDGDDCASSLCVEGPGPSGQHYCSDECEGDDGCGGALPVCASVSFVGRICIRTP